MNSTDHPEYQYFHPDYLRRMFQNTLYGTGRTTDALYDLPVAPYETMYPTSDYT